MSIWSSVYAILHVFTYKTTPDFEKLLQSALNEAPKITGSEGDCDYSIINVMSYTFESRDCRRCQWLSTMNEIRCTKNYNEKYCIEGTYADRCDVVITPKHGLRDKTKQQSEIEFKNLVNFLKKYQNGIFKVEIVTKKII